MRLLLLFLLLPFHYIWAQPTSLHVPFQRANGTSYKHALAGGLNNPQFSTIDLDGDGTDDMVYFDRQGGVVVPFLNNGTSNTVDYTYAPDYSYRFPKLERFMLLRDYNCDGIKDLFAYNYDYNTGQVGITAYRGSRDAQNKIVFTAIKTIIEFHLKGQSNYYNLFVSSVDIPDINDIDGDGDLDILNFNSSGGYVEYFLNESQELGWGCDSLQYVFRDNCWGRFYESGVTEVIDLSNNIDSCAAWPGWTPPTTQGPRHAGSTLLSLDMDNDNDRELLLGDLSFKNINLLTNGGSADTAWMVSQEVFFPQNSTFINIDIFPAAFYEDMNNDGKKDLLAAPNIEGNAANKAAWYYQNTGTASNPIFTYQQNNFLVEEMIDLGTGAAPALVDLNGDGLLDLVVGNNQEFISVNSQVSYLNYYQNIGTTNQPIFKFTQGDFANLQQYNLERLVPTFGDLDNDGDQDLMIGTADGMLIYCVNQGSAAAPSFPSISANYAAIDVGQNAVPQLVDADRDNDLDLVVGERNGNTNYFENTGTATTPTFSSTATTETFGWIDTKLPGLFEGNSAPHLVDIDGTYHFFLGNESGELWHYDNVDGNLLGTFNRVHTVLDSIDEGEESIWAVSDIDNNNTLDFLVGNKRGGLGFFTSALLSPIDALQKVNNQCVISPNPTTHSIKIDFSYVMNKEVSIQIRNLLGQSLFQTTRWIEQSTTLSLANLPTGVYLIQLSTKNQQYTHKFVKK